VSAIARAAWAAALCGVGVVLVAGPAGAAAAIAPTETPSRFCGIVQGASWAQRIDPLVHVQFDPSRVRLVRGTRYAVRARKVGCGWAKKQVPRLTRLGGAANVGAVAFGAIRCFTYAAKFEHVDGYRVRWVSAPSIRGACTDWNEFAPADENYRLFTWEPSFRR
jgi:hypothetical protein